MALFLKQDFDSRSELQNKLAMELQERAKLKAKNADLPDGINDSKYIEGTKNTTSLAWVWILILLSAFGIAIWLIVK